MRRVPVTRAAHFLGRRLAPIAVLALAVACGSTAKRVGASQAGLVPADGTQSGLDAPMSAASGNGGLAGPAANQAGSAFGKTSGRVPTSQPAVVGPAVAASQPGIT